MEKKNTLLLTVIAVATLLVAVVGATFAYFAGSSDTSANINVTANTASAASSFVASAGDPLSLSITPAMMQESAISLDAKTSDDGGLTVTFTTAVNDQNASCTYDLEYVWDSANEGETINQYVPTGTLPLEIADNDPRFGAYHGTYNFEYSIEGSVVKTTDGNAAPSNNLLPEKDFSKFATWTGTQGATGYSTLILEDQVIQNSKTATPSTDVYSFTTRFYNIPRDQNAISDKNYAGHIQVTNVVC